MTTSETISAFLEFLRTADQDLRIAIELESESNAETQDILHAIEFGTTSARPSTIVKKLKYVRNKRRMNKDKIEVLTLVSNWTETNKMTVKSLEQLLGAVRKAETRIEGRMYMPRTDILDEGGSSNEHRGSP